MRMWCACAQVKLWTCDEIVLILINLTGRLHSTEPVIWERQRPRFRFLLHRNVKRTWRYQTCALCYSSFEQALWLLGKFNGDFQCEMLRNFHRSVSSLLTIRSSLSTRPKDSRVLYFWNSPVKLNSSDNKVTKIKFSEHVQSTSHGCHYTFNPLTLKIWSLILSSCC